MRLETDTICLSAWFIIPLVFAVWWTRARLGLDKRWFVVSAYPLISRGFYFFLPTFVIGSTIFFSGLTLPDIDPDGKIMIIGLCFYLFGFVFAYLEPNWMSPGWYRWLKKNHGDIMPYLVLDAHKMGRETWMEQVKTQKGLEEWANEVRRKYTR